MVSSYTNVQVQVLTDSRQTTEVQADVLKAELQQDTEPDRSWDYDDTSS